MAQSYLEMCQSNNIKFYFVFCIPHPPLRYCKSFDFHLVASEWVVEIDRSSEISHPVVCHAFKVPFSKLQINRSFLDIDQSSEIYHPLVCGRAIGLANLAACLGYRYIYFVSFLFESGWLYYKKSFVSLDRIGV